MVFHLTLSFFDLLSSESTIHAITAHLARNTGARFHFLAPEKVALLKTIHQRLRSELDGLIVEVINSVVEHVPNPKSCVERLRLVFSHLLHTASDVWQAQTLLGDSFGNVDLQEPVAKRACVVKRFAKTLTAVDFAVEFLKAATMAECGLDVSVEDRGPGSSGEEGDGANAEVTERCTTRLSSLADISAWAPILSVSVHLQ